MHQRSCARVIQSLLCLALAGVVVAPSAHAEPDAAAKTAAPAEGEGATPKSPAAGAAAAAAGDGASAEDDAPTPRRMVASLSHELQFGIAVLVGDGYRVIKPYKADIECGDAKVSGNPVCTSRAPSFIDLQPSFGITHSWDVLTDFRISLEHDFTTYRQFYVMPGFRYWLDAESPVKFFTTLQFAIDHSNQNRGAVADPNLRVSNTDLAFRNSNGLMIEVMRNFGVYAQFGETIGFYRWLSFLVDAGIGVQARVP